ncbi:RALF-like protein [Medicago truncatula]|uniref:RALF-like protein n=1 Tax=Medicago truncatula TaxID=3880 RepID=A0A072TLU0_MEDTR|nr:RALF-like protein [Medicago truncatula]
MAKFITTSFVLVLIVVAFPNGAYSVDEGEGRGNYKLRKDNPNLYSDFVLQVHGFSSCVHSL